MTLVFLVLYLVLFLVLPTWLGIRISSNHGRGALMGGLLGFFVSWLGVLITWLIVRNEPRTQTAA